MLLKQVIIKAPGYKRKFRSRFQSIRFGFGRANDKVTLTAIPNGIKIEVSRLRANTISTITEKNTAGIVAHQILANLVGKQVSTQKLRREFAQTLDLAVAPQLHQQLPMN